MTLVTKSIDCVNTISIVSVPSNLKDYKLIALYNSKVCRYLMKSNVGGKVELS